jgi:hypothetical protein
MVSRLRVQFAREIYLMKLYVSGERTVHGKVADESRANQQIFRCCGTVTSSADVGSPAVCRPHKRQRLILLLYVTACCGT